MGFHGGPAGPRRDDDVEDPRMGPAPEESLAICELDTPDLIDMILTFTAALTGIKFYNYQFIFCRRIVESVLENDGEEITGLWSRQSGKTEALADLGYSLCILLPTLAKAFPDDPRLSSYITGFWIGIYAPIASQASISFNRMRKLSTRPGTLAVMNDSEVNVRVEVSRGDTVTFSNGSMIEAHSASPDSQIEGKTWHLVMLEESQKLTQTKVEKEIGPMLTSTNGCLTGNSLIWMADGRRVPIRDLVEVQPANESVMAVEDEGLGSWRLVPKKIEAYHDNGVKPCLRIKLRGGREIESTHNHHFVRLHNIRRDQWGWKRADELRVGDRVAVPWQMVSSGVEVPGPLPELLGWVISEGCLTDCSVEIAVTVPDLIDDIAQLVAQYGDDVKWVHNGGRKGRITNVVRGTRKLNRFQQELDSLGLWGHSAFEKRIPEPCFGWDNDALIRLLSRLYAGDGCAHFGKVPVIKYTSVNPQLAEDVVAVLDRLGIYSTIQPHHYTVGEEDRTAWDVLVSDIESQRRFFAVIPWMKEVNDLPAFSSYLSESKGKIRNMPVRFEKIESIEDIGLQHTYDLQVADSHNYVANGIISHNTMVKIGTAWISRGGFHKSIQQNLEIWKRTGKRNHFEFPYDIVIAEKNKAYAEDKNPFHLKYEKWIKKQIVKLGGVDSIEFKMNFRCLWNESRLLAVNPEVLKNVGLTEFEMGAPYTGGLRVGGLDIGKVSDSTVLTVMDVDMANPVVNKLRVEGQDEDRQVYYRKCIQDWFVTEGAFEGTDGQYETVAEFILQSGIRVLAVDSTGIGDAFYERLEAMLGTNVFLIPCNFAIQNKARYYKYFLQELHAYRLYYPAGPLTRDSEPYRRWMKECEDLDRVQHGLHVTYQHPDGEGYHDDFPDSAALACWAERLAPTLEMHEMDVSYLGRDGSVHQNLNQLREGGGSRSQRYQGRRSR